MNTSNKANAASCRVVAPSSREALRLVREKLGPDAIVLSNKVTAHGVEIVAALEQVLTAVVQAATQDAESATVPATTFRLPAMATDGDAVLREIHSMRGMIEEQLAGITWSSAQRRDPVRGQLLRTLLGAGFSARLSKDLLADLPIGQSYSNGLNYVKAAIEHQLPVLEDENALMDEGGVYALMGPTGVGKTTTTAKLAARCVMRFGPEKLALVTTDSYRIGAYEQLRIYGKILGVSVHAVKDAADLELVLSELRDKHMVLIDTVGMSQRDRAVADQIAMLCSASRPVKRLLLLNATSHGDTLNEVVEAYRRGGPDAGMHNLVGCIFTKVDEATHPGVLLDMAIRHRLPVHYISSGQKVPEHLALGNRQVLVNKVFQVRSSSAMFIPREVDQDDGPVVPPGDNELQAAEAVSERLRSHCQQLIRALTHNAQELTSSAAALSAGQIGFDETRALWRKLSDERVGHAEISQELQTQVFTATAATCSDYVLMLAGETSVAKGGESSPYSRASAVLLSDCTGLPFAAVPHLSAPNVQSGLLQGGMALQQQFAKPVVHLLAGIPKGRLIDQWHSSGQLWVASATGSLRIAPVSKGAPGTLAKISAALSFSPGQAIWFRGKSALLSVAEAFVSLPPEPVESNIAQAASATMRCVVRRVTDASSGKPLTHSYLLASSDVHAAAEQIAEWPTWRAAAEPHFKLLAQTIVQLADGESSTDAAELKRLLIAGHVCTTVLRLQRAPHAWADTARKVLTQLTGRTVRPGSPVPGPVLLEGLGKLFVLLDALETEASAASPGQQLVAVQG